MTLELITEELIARQTPEAQAIIRVLAETIARLTQRMAEMQAKLNETQAELDALKKKSPRNSSQPPSTQHPHAKPAPPKSKSQPKPGGQPGHAQARRPLVPPDRNRSQYGEE